MTKKTSSTQAKTQLPPKQELFCQLYATDREFFGNGAQSYIEAYNIDLGRKGAYRGAISSANRLLTNADILLRINELLESAVLNDEFVDKQIAFLITQNADLKSKVAAIREYNALRNRITKKLDVTSDGKKLETAVVVDLGNVQNINETEPSS